MRPSRQAWGAIAALAAWIALAIAVRGMNLLIHASDDAHLLTWSQTILGSGAAVLTAAHARVAALREALEAWRDFAEHLAGCVECGQTHWDNCSDGKELHDAAERAERAVEPAFTTPDTAALHTPDQGTPL